MPSSYEKEVELAPLGNPEAPGALAARIDPVAWAAYSYLVEYRHNSGWDQGIPSNAVLVHEVRQDGYSYLTAALTSADEQYMSSQFEFGVVLDKVDTNKATIHVGRAPFVRLSGDVETLSSDPVGRGGTYHFPGTKYCPAGDYTYVRELRHQSAHIWADGDLFDPAPTTFEWSLNDVVLDPAAKNVVLPVTTRSALPPPSGKLTYGHDAVIEYAYNSISSVSLQNRPEDASYSVTLRAVAVNASGQSASAEREIEFEGDVLVFEREYYEVMRRCLTAQKAILSKKKTKPKKPPKGGDPGPVKTAKRKLAQAVREIVQEHPGLGRGMEKRFGNIVRLHGGLPPAKRQSAKSKRTKQSRQRPHAPG